LLGGLSRFPLFCCRPSVYSFCLDASCYVFSLWGNGWSSFFLLRTGCLPDLLCGFVVTYGLIVRGSGAFFVFRGRATVAPLEVPDRCHRMACQSLPEGVAQISFVSPCPLFLGFSVIRLFLVPGSGIRE